ncbi:L-cystine-binding protein TcyA precursor [compost metagenome]
MAKWFRFLTVLLLSTPALAHPKWKALTTELLPYSYQEDTNVTGASTDIIKEMLQRAEMIAEYYLWPRQRCLSVTETRENHFFYAIARIPEREDKYKWVGPLASADFIVVALESRDDIPETKDVETLRKYKIGAVTDSLEAVLMENKGFKVEKVKDQAQNIKKIKARRVDLFIGTKHQIKSLEDKYAVKLKKVSRVQDVPYYAAFHKKTSDQFITQFNQILNDMKKDGTTDKIYMKYGLNK